MVIFTVLNHFLMKRTPATIILVLLAVVLKAQFGAVVTPYFWSTSFRSDMYSRTNGFGNIPLGFDAVFNYNNRLFINVASFRMMGEKTMNHEHNNYGYGVPNGFTHRKFRWTEFHIAYAPIGRKWENLEKWAPALAFRTGVIFNSRMTMLAPQIGNDTVYTQTPPYMTDSVVPLNRFDLTGLKQTMVFGGISVKIMKYKEIHFSGGGDWWKNLTTGEIFYVPSGAPGNSYYRVRQWDIYADFLYAPVSTFDGYLGWDDHQLGTRAITAADIPGKENMGWRFGVRHMAYNVLGLQWVIEYMQLPGQKPFPDTEDLDEPTRKNRYFMIGLNVSLGFSAGS